MQPSDILKNHPNLQAILDGRVSHPVIEWPGVRIELKTLIDEFTAALQYIHLEIGDIICETSSLHSEHYADNHAWFDKHVNWINGGYVGATNTRMGGDVYIWSEITLIRKGFECGQRIYKKLASLQNDDEGLRFYMNSLNPMEIAALQEYMKPVHEEFRTDDELQSEIEQEKING
jgi:hypothetical protein